jgi:hypothetical protein
MLSAAPVARMLDRHDSSEQRKARRAVANGASKPFAAALGLVFESGSSLPHFKPDFSWITGLP